MLLTGSVSSIKTISTLSWCILFVDNIILIDETIRGYNHIDWQRDTLESNKSSRLSISKTDW